MGILWAVLAAVVADNAVVVLVGDGRNRGLVRCGTTLLHQLRTVGAWHGPVYALVNAGVRLPPVWAEMKVTPVYVKPFAARRYHKMVKYDKFYLFSLPAFRKHPALLYLDVDGNIRQPIAPLWFMLAAANQTLLLRDNGPGVGKGSFYSEEVKQGRVLSVPDSRNPGASCLMLINTRRLPPPPAMRAAFLTSLKTLPPLLVRFDQGIIGSVFRHEYAVFAPCVPLKVVGADEPAPKWWFLDHCRGRVDIYNHDHKKLCARA